MVVIEVGSHLYCGQVFGLLVERCCVGHSRLTNEECTFHTDEDGLSAIQFGDPISRLDSEVTRNPSRDHIK